MSLNVPLRFLLFALVLRFVLIFWGPHHFSSSTYDYISLKDYERLQRTTRVVRMDRHIPLCPPLPAYNLQARNSINHQKDGFWTLEDVELDEKLVSQSMGVNMGGSWSPNVCNPVHHVVLIIPFRERMVQLKKFLVYMHHFLQLQLVSYKIFVIEQRDELPFNRGKLFNIGYNISAKEDPTLECFIFHDVDLLPENIFNIYGCSQRPRHMSAVTNSFRYTLLYPTLFGGATSITSDVFDSVNGFSNSFFGWGGEDDNFYERLENKGIDAIRLSPAISSYRMLPHKKEAASSERLNLLKSGKLNHEVDGLNSLKFTILNHISGPLYTLIQVKL